MTLHRRPLAREFREMREAAKLTKNIIGILQSFLLDIFPFLS
jgi:hypothetical protein